MTRTADTIRAELAAALSVTPKTRRTRELVESLQWDLDHATATSAINARRADMGLQPFPGA